MKKMARFAPALLLALSLVSCTANTAKEQSAQPTQATPSTESAQEAYPTISVQELKTVVDAKAYVLDVRTPQEYAAGHIASAVNLPLDEVEARASEVPGDQPVYVICRSGNRSAQASTILKQAGKDVRNVAGGMSDWEAAGYPVTR